MVGSIHAELNPIRTDSNVTVRIRVRKNGGGKDAEI